MKKSKNRRQFNRPTSYYIWVGVFFLFLFTLTGSFYYASQKIEYIWRWNRLPIYFVYKDDIEITSEIDGEVESIVLKEKEAVITIKGMDASESYKAPAESVKVDVAEMISYGDTLAVYQKWKPGLLIIGLWVTLKLSLTATIFGVIIGTIGGLSRVSSNPAFRWLATAYVELIRGSPLMVQILIWYFVLGTMINDLLTTYGLGYLSAFWYGVASLSCFAGAYVTEIVRAGIQSIHRGQTEAARSLGMSYAQSMLHIILPQGDAKNSATACRPAYQSYKRLLVAGNHCNSRVDQGCKGSGNSESAAV